MANPISRPEFDKCIDRVLKERTASYSKYTYIAKQGNGDIYKFGASSDPMRREKQLNGAYKGFKVVFFIEAEIELQIHMSLVLSGAENALGKGRYNGPREAFRLNSEDVDYIVRHCGFRKIADFDKSYFDSLPR